MQKRPDLLGWNSPLLKLIIAVFSLACVGAVAIIDYVTQYETAVSILYMLPIIAAVWLSWAPVAMLTALLGGISDTAVNCLFGHSCSRLGVLNSIIEGTFFIVFTLTLIALKDSQVRLKRLALSDALTNVANSRHFLDVGTAEINRAQRYKHPFSIVYMDIDDFKSVNDSLGHSFGDVLLCEVARLVKTMIRKTDTLARLGGDEFAILMPETDAAAARIAVKRIQKSLLDILMASKRSVTFSIGVVTDSGTMCTFDQLLKKADGLMYEAKKNGKNSVKYGVLVCAAKEKQSF